MKEALRSMTEDMMAMIRRKDFAPFNLALSGGETAKHMFSLWVDEYKDKIDWNNIRFFWVDERCVPPTSPDSNYGHANHLLFKPLCIPADHIHHGLGLGVLHGLVEGALQNRGAHLRAAVVRRGSGVTAKCPITTPIPSPSP